MKRAILPRLFLALMIMSSMMFIYGCASTSAVKEAAVAEEVPVITEIKIQENRLDIVSNKHFIYTTYAENDPYRMTIDIPDMTLGTFTSKIVSDKAGIAEITPRQIESPKPAVKFHVVLQSPASVTPSYANNTLTLLFKSEQPVAVTEAAGANEAQKAETKEESKAPEAVASAPAVNAAPAQPAEPEKADKIEKGSEPPAKPATEINSISLKSEPDKVKVLITGNGSMTPNVFPIDERIVVDVPGVVLKAAMPSGAVSPLRQIRSGKYKNKVRLVLDLKEKTAYDVVATGSEIEISLRKKDLPAKAAEPSTAEPALAKAAPNGEPKETAAQTEPVPQVVEAKPEGRYKGKKISLDFQDADIGPIFRLLADVAGYNLVLDPSVKGKITIKLLNVPWDQALDIVLNTFSLDKSIEGNILWIAPTTVFAKLVDEKAKAKDVEEKAEDLVQEVIRVNYASASEIQSAINGGKLLSPRGTITPDVRLNTLIVKDTQKSIEKIRELVKIMDVSKPQVLIEAKIVEVSSNYSESLGIRWGGNLNIPSWPDTLTGDFSVNTPTVSAGSSTTNSGGAVNFTIGNASTVNVNLSLSALETIGKSKTLSNPKILTMDNEAASIQQGRTFFIPTVSQSGTQTQAQSATLSLNVTPKITPDGYVQLKVTATDNSLESGSGENAVVSTKSLTTQALVKNGETLVLGGIYTSDQTDTEEAVPWLSKVPVLGWLFKTRTQTGPNYKELLIFITPTIMGQQL